jgi:hypothetical protein
VSLGSAIRPRAELLLWRTRSDVVAAPIVEIQHSAPAARRFRKSSEQTAGSAAVRGALLNAASH